MKKTISKKNGELIDINVAEEIKTKVPGYILTKEGYFIEVPFDILHHDLFYYFLKLYTDKEPLENHIGFLKSEIIKEGFVIYLGNLPGLRGIYTQGRMYIPKNLTKEQVDSIFLLDSLKDMDFLIYEDEEEITPDFIEEPILLSDLKPKQKILEKN